MLPISGLKDSRTASARESTLQILNDWEKNIVEPAILSFLKERQTKHELHKCWNFYLGLMESDDWYFISESSDRLLQEFREYFSSIKARLREEQEKRVHEEREKYWKERELELLDEARHAERVGRYEDAAHNYEMLADHYEMCKLYEKARELRDRARQLRGKGRQVVVVDLNKLIQQVKNGGIVVAYRCPNCGGKLEIGKDTSAESLKVCKYCGSQIEAMDLANFLRTALS